MTDLPAHRSALSIARRVIVGVIIASFGLAALGGIVVLLGAELGTEAGRVLGTTAVVGAFSVAVLCCVALAGRRPQVFGFVGAAVCAIAAALVIWLIWYSADTSGTLWDTLVKAAWTGVAASIAFSFGSLLLLLSDRRRAAVRVGLVITLALFALVLGMVLILIWWSDAVDSEVFPRVLGIASILAALGAVVVPVLSLLLPESRAGSAAPATLPPGLAERLVAEAARRGVTVQELVAPLFETARGPSAPE